MRKDRNKIKGFVLLMVMLVISIILVVGMGVVGIIIREMFLASLGRESEKAFYAADTGIECATFWDIRGRAFDSPAYTITCAETIINESMDVDPVAMSTTTTFSLDLSNGSCVEIFIDRSDYLDPYRITIEARGYNIGCNESSRNKVERAIKSSY